MNALPENYETLLNTSKKHYLTGMTALNIPSPEGTGGDWHFHEAFYGRGERKPKIFLAGEGEELNTNNILQDLGVHECSNILRHKGVPIPEGTKIYSANHYRAILDMVYECIKTLKSYPYDLDINDWLDNEQEKQPFINLLFRLKPYFSDDEWKILQDWMSKQI